MSKIVAGTLLAGLIGILVIGAVNRTVAKTETVEARGQGRGRAEGEAADYLVGEGRGGNGRGGQGADASGRGYPNDETAPENWQTLAGTVVRTPEDGDELVIETAEGQEITIGTGPAYMAEQGFALQRGEQVQVQGYWEEGEFKAAQVTRLRDGQTIALRDDYGRPAWAGGGRGDAGGQGPEDASGDQSGAGQAQVDEWLQIHGTVVSVDADALLVQTAEGEQIAVENRPWWFVQEQGFGAQAGDEVTLTGFYEGGEFEVGRIDDVTSGQMVLIRDEDGRPLWAGRGRRGG